MKIRRAGTSFIHQLILGLCLITTRMAHADSWLPPSEFETASENHHFLARVIPATETAKPLLMVLAVTPSSTNELWRTRLSNTVSPCEVWISDDGESVVTADNYARVGYGDDVIAIYNRQGQLAKYSLEQIAPPQKPKSDVHSFPDDGYGDKIIHTTSSRRWSANSIEFFHRQSGQLLFCLWLDWETRWVTWRMTDGQIIALTGPQTKEVTLQGRTCARAEVLADSNARAALNFLGRLHFKEDRPLIEAWLSDTNFSSGSWESSSSDPPQYTFAFAARSYRRDTAEQLLARWDGKGPKHIQLGNLDKYRYLGTLNCVVTFPHAPAKGEGTIRLYLIPSSTPLNEWAAAPPTQYLIANLNAYYPTIRAQHEWRDGQLSRDVNFVISGITPGEYRLKAVWNRAAPFADADQVIYAPHPGDYESSSSPKLTIKRAGTTHGIKLECSTPVK